MESVLLDAIRMLERLDEPGVSDLSHGYVSQNDLREMKERLHGVIEGMLLEEEVPMSRAENFAFMRIWGS